MVGRLFFLLLLNMYAFLFAPVVPFLEVNDNNTKVTDDQFYTDINAIAADFIQHLTPIKNNKEQMLSKDTLEFCILDSIKLYGYEPTIEKWVNFCKKNDLNVSVYRIGGFYYILPIYVKDLCKSIGMGYEVSIPIKNKTPDLNNIPSTHTYQIYVLDSIVFNPIEAILLIHKYPDFLFFIKSFNAKIKEYIQGDSVWVVNEESPAADFFSKMSPSAVLQLYFAYFANLFYYKKDYAPICLQMTKLLLDKSFLQKVTKKNTFNNIVGFINKKEKMKAIFRKTFLSFNLELFITLIYVVRTVDDFYYLVPARLVHEHNNFFNIPNVDICDGLLIYEYIGNSKQFNSFLDTIFKKPLVPKKLLSQKEVWDIKYDFYDRYVKTIYEYEQKHGITIESYKVLQKLSFPFGIDYFDDLYNWQQKLSKNNRDMYIVKSRFDQWDFINKKVLDYLQFQKNVDVKWEDSKTISIESYVDILNLEDDDVKKMNSNNSWYSKVKKIGSDWWSSLTSFK